MINWVNLAASALWIIGCALGLAAVSYADWEAAMSGERLRVRLRQPRIQIAIHLAGALFCLGLAATGRTWWERALWGLLVVAWAVQAWLVGLCRKRSAERRRTKDAAGGDDGH